MSTNSSTNIPTRRASMAGVVIVAGIAVLLLLVALVLITLSSLPDQKRLMTPEAVVGTPAFAPEVEARVQSASAAKGEMLFSLYGCTACHAGEKSTGPQIAGVGQRAGTRRSNYSAAAYIYESIVAPNAFTVPDYPAGVMVQNFKQSIPEYDLYNLIAWLLTQ